MQSTCAPVNDNIMNLLIILDSIKRASASCVTAVIPYFGYSRQEKKTQGREPITAKLVANLLTVAGAKRIITFDLHTHAIQGFFDIPVDHLTAIPLLCNHFMEKNFTDEIVVVSPDAGGVARARFFAKRLNASLAIIDKRRPSPNQAEMTNLVGDVDGKIAILVDDMIDTAGTISKAAELLKKKGAKQVYAAATHAVFSGPAVPRLMDSEITEVVVTNTLPMENRQFSKLTVLSIAPLISEAIYRINHQISVSSLFE
jgi:ribose-phosphate pyrophosphokinase